MKKIIGILLASLILLSSFTAYASGYYIFDGQYFSDENEGKELYSYNDADYIIYENFDYAELANYYGKEENVIIPEEVNGYKVKSVREWSFYNNKKVRSVVFPKTVEIIDDGVFYDCNNIEKIEIKGKLKHLGAIVEKNSKLCKNKNNWDKGVLYLGKYVAATNNLKGSYTVKKGTLGIANYAFSNESITSVNLPDSVRFIGESAFEDCENLKSVKLKNGIEYIGENAFSKVPAANNWSGGLQYIGKYLIGSKNKKSYKVKEGTLLIATKTFSYSYEKTSSMESIYLPDSIKYINSHAFNHCEKLKSVKLPKNLIEFGNSAFYQCTGIKKISIDKENKYYSSKSGVLFNKDKTSLIYYPPKSSRASYTVPSSVKRIEEYAFFGAENLQQIKLNEGLYYIGRSSFKNCYKLKDYYIPASVERIGFDAIGTTIFYTPDEICYGKVEGVKIWGKSGSYAEIYSKCIIGDTGILGREFKYVCEEEHSFKTVKEKKSTYFERGISEYKICEKCGFKEDYIRLDRLAPKAEIKGGKSRITVKYKKIKGMSGYQVRYTLKGKTKTKTYKSAKAATRAIKKLKKGTYSVKFRAFKTYEGEKYYTIWSKPVKVKVK